MEEQAQNHPNPFCKFRTLSNTHGPGIGSNSVAHENAADDFLHLKTEVRFSNMQSSDGLNSDSNGRSRSKQDTRTSEHRKNLKKISVLQRKKERHENMVVLLQSQIERICRSAISSPISSADAHYLHARAFNALPVVKAKTTSLNIDSSSSLSRDPSNSTRDGAKKHQDQSYETSINSNLCPMSTPSANVTANTEPNSAVIGPDGSSNDQLNAGRHSHKARQHARTTPGRRRRDVFKHLHLSVSGIEPGQQARWLTGKRDTAASRCIAKRTTAEKLGWDPVCADGKGLLITFRGFGRSGFAQSLGSFIAIICLPGHRKVFIWRLHVVEDDDLPLECDMLLSETLCKKGRLLLDGLSGDIRRHSAKSKPHSRRPLAQRLAERLAASSLGGSQ